MVVAGEGTAAVVVAVVVAVADIAVGTAEGTAVGTVAGPAVGSIQSAGAVEGSNLEEAVVVGLAPGDKARTG